jgi:hypothetical protein
MLLEKSDIQNIHQKCFIDYNNSTKRNKIKKVRTANNFRNETSPTISNFKERRLVVTAANVISKKTPSLFNPCLSAGRRISTFQPFHFFPFCKKSFAFWTYLAILGHTHLYPNQTNDRTP